MAENELKIGFCPTMAEIAKTIGIENKNVALYPLGSAAEALYYVKNTALDCIVIGRIAKVSEISESVRRMPLQENGTTLVARRKGFIDYHDLPLIPIVTYLDEHSVASLITDTRNTQFVADFDEAMAQLTHSNAALIAWKDYNDSLELLIPADEVGNKIIDFRLPTLYYQAGKEGIVRNLKLDGLI